MSYTPAYVKSFQNDRFRDKIKSAHANLADCTLCPRECHTNRLENASGICKTGKNARVAGYHPHFGEEAPLVGTGGSGTIFFSYCNLMCNFCQNYDISHEGYGREVSAEALAAMMLDLQDQGCHNINFVTPSHVVPQILSAVEIAAAKGLMIPLVYNTSGYDKVDTLKLLEGVIDIYMPDFKFWNNDAAQAMCQAPDYRETACRAVKEMHRQVGDLKLNHSGIAVHGLLVRHLVLPAGLAGTREIMRFLAREISSGAYVNIMPQYRPCGKINGMDELLSKLNSTEYIDAVMAALEEGITRLDGR